MEGTLRFGRFGALGKRLVLTNGFSFEVSSLRNRVVGNSLGSCPGDVGSIPTSAF